MEKELLVTTKKGEAAPLQDGEFAKRLKALRQLQEKAKDAYGAAVGAILTFAVEYASLYETVARDAGRVRKLNDALGLDYAQSTRMRTIANKIELLKPIQNVLPPALESIYEVARQIKKDGGHSVQKAIKSQRLTPQSTLRDVRRMSVPVISATEMHDGPTTSREGQPRFKNEPTDLEEFIRALKRITPTGCLVLADVDVDNQAYGTTVMGNFTITNIQVAKDGTLPSAVPSHIAEAVRRFAR